MLRLSDEVVEITMRRGEDFVMFMGNTAAHTVTTPLRFTRPLRGRYHVRYVTSLLGEWLMREKLQGRKLESGFAVDLDASGFCAIELRPIG